MTEIVIGKEALLHFLRNEGINVVLEEPVENENYGSIETKYAIMTFRYPEKE